MVTIPSSEGTNSSEVFLPAERAAEYDSVIDAMLDELKAENHDAAHSGVQALEESVVYEIGKRITERINDRIFSGYQFGLRMLYGAALGYGKEMQEIARITDCEEELLKTLEGMFLVDYGRRMRSGFGK